MKRLLLLATPVILALAGCAAQPPKNLDAPVVVKTATQGDAVIAAGAATKPSVKVDFKDNPDVAAQFERDFAEKGYSTAVDAASADVVISIDSGYSFQKPHARRHAMSLGKLLAHKDIKPHLDDAAEKSTRTTSLTLQNFSMTPGAFLGTSIFQAIGEVSGLRGGFNRALVGDERGICLTSCDQWHTYDQRLVLKATVTPRGSTASDVTTTSTVMHERLVPIEMYLDARTKLLAALAGS